MCSLVDLTHDQSHARLFGSMFHKGTVKKLKLLKEVPKNGTLLVQQHNNGNNVSLDFSLYLVLDSEYIATRRDWRLNLWCITAGYNTRWNPPGFPNGKLNLDWTTGPVKWYVFSEPE